MALLSYKDMLDISKVSSESIKHILYCNYKGNNKKRILSLEVWREEAGGHVCAQGTGGGLQHGAHLPDGGGYSGSRSILGWQQGHQKVRIVPLRHRLQDKLVIKLTACRFYSTKLTSLCF